MIRITPYGRNEVVLFGGICLLLAVICGWLLAPSVYAWVVAGVFVAGFVAILGFFRDPVRVVPSNPAIVVSPADGKVADIEEVDEGEYLEGRALRIGIFLSVFDVHVNRAPVAGTVEYVKHRPGRCRNAFTAESTKDNESNALGMRSTGGMRILVRQLTGAVARRIVCRSEPGSTLARGETYGMIKFGSRTELFLPIASVREVKVQVGDTVRGGETILGEWDGDGSGEPVAANRR